MIAALDVGCRDTSFLKHYVGEFLPHLHGEVIVTRLDVNPDNNPDILQDIQKPFEDKWDNPFDVVYASHVMEHITWWKVLYAASNLVKTLKIGGYLIILVPSMEWAASQFMKGINDMSVLGAVYGGQRDPWDNHLCGFTRPALEKMAERLNLKVVNLTKGPFLAIIMGNEFLCEQNILVAQKLSHVIVSDPTSD